MNSLLLNVGPDYQEKLYKWMRTHNTTKVHLKMEMFLTGTDNQITVRGEYSDLCDMIVQCLADNDLSVYLDYVKQIRV